VLPLRVEVFPGDGRDRISVGLGPPTGRIITAEFLRAAQPAGTAGGAAGAMHVQRTLVTLNPVTGETQRVPERRGTTVRGSLPAFDLDRWLPLIAESGTAAGAPGAGEGAGYDVRIGVLDALGKRMRSVALQGVADGSGWSANINTAEFAGDVVYRSEGNGRLVARLARFTMPEDSPNARPGEGAKDLPAVDIVADNFTHRGRKLGRVEVLARHEGRDWRIEKLAVTNPDAALSGTGVWKQGEASRTSLAFKLDVSDAGNFLDRFGYPEHLKGGRAKLEGTLNWNGDPVNMDYATLGGQLQMEVDDGQFLEIEPGIGKLVSLMSLQMLPRRATGDFRDVFSKGFQFDRITEQHGDRARGDGGEAIPHERAGGRRDHERAGGPVAGDAEPQRQGDPAVGGHRLYGSGPGASARGPGHADRRPHDEESARQGLRVRLRHQRHVVGSQDREAAAHAGHQRARRPGFA
jgi:hypothetical protein